MFHFYPNTKENFCDRLFLYLYRALASDLSHSSRIFFDEWDDNLTRYPMIFRSSRQGYQFYGIEGNEFSDCRLPEPIHTDAMDKVMMFSRNIDPDGGRLRELYFIPNIFNCALDNLKIPVYRNAKKKSTYYEMRGVVSLPKLIQHLFDREESFTNEEAHEILYKMAMNAALNAIDDLDYRVMAEQNYWDHNYHLSVVKEDVALYITDPDILKDNFRINHQKDTMVG